MAWYNFFKRRAAAEQRRKGVEAYRRNLAEETKRRQADDITDPFNPLNPINPLNPLSPLSPLWNQDTSVPFHDNDNNPSTSPSIDNCNNDTSGSSSYDSGSCDSSGGGSSGGSSD